MIQLSANLFKDRKHVRVENFGYLDSAHMARKKLAILFAETQSIPLLEKETILISGHGEFRAEHLGNSFPKTGQYVSTDGNIHAVVERTQHPDILEFHIEFNIRELDDAMKFYLEIRFGEVKPKISYEEKRDKIPRFGSRHEEGC